MKWYNISNKTTGEYISQVLAESTLDAEAEALQLYPQYKGDGVFAIQQGDF